MNEEESNKLASFSLVVACMMGIAFIMHRCNPLDAPIIEERIDTIVVSDTVVLPVPVTNEVVRREVVKASNTPSDTSIIVVHDTITNEVYVDIPISQKTYDDSTYHAVVSGYNPSLDTLIVNQKEIHKTMVVKETITKTKRLGLGVSAGYDPINNRPSVMIGLNYNIFGIR